MTKYLKANYDVSESGNFFVRVWFLMLALGGLGHQLHLPKLFLSYWTCALIVVVALMLQKNHVTRWKFSDNKDIYKG